MDLFSGMLKRPKLRPNRTVTEVDRDRGEPRPRPRPRLGLNGVPKTGP